jgi:hypothetical protein
MEERRTWQDVQHRTITLIQETVQMLFTVLN